MTHENATSATELVQWKPGKNFLVSPRSALANLKAMAIIDANQVFDRTSYTLSLDRLDVMKFAYPEALSA